MKGRGKNIVWRPFVWTKSRTAKIGNLAAAEAILDVKFPDDYRRFVRLHQGQSPEPSEFDFQQEGNPNTSTVNVLLHFLEPEGNSDAAEYNIVQTNRNARDSLAPRLIAFAEDPAGNYLAFDFRRPATPPPVVFVDHERVGGPGWVSPVAATFTEFLRLLRA
jgi:cell wall assembly regulator SMI1